MPGGFPLGLEICNGSAVVNASSASAGVSLTLPGSANTKSAYTQLTASSSSDCSWIFIAIENLLSTPPNAEISIDIAVGGSGSEQVIIANLVGDYNQIGAAFTGYGFPVQIPSGTRIAARCQAGAGSPPTGSINVALYLFDGAFTSIEGCAGVDAIGFVSATTQGSTITASASTNTKGSYTQLVASSNVDYIGFVAMFDTLNAQAASSTDFLVDIAVGASGSEQVVVPNLFMRRSNPLAKCDANVWGPFWIPIPAGTRLSARCQGTVANGTVGLTLYGIYQ